MKTVALILVLLGLLILLRIGGITTDVSVVDNAVGIFVRSLGLSS